VDESGGYGFIGDDPRSDLPSILQFDIQHPADGLDGMGDHFTSRAHSLHCCRADQVGCLPHAEAAAAGHRELVENRIKKPR
jgi:hypothetical protein